MPNATTNSTDIEGEASVAIKGELSRENGQPFDAQDGSDLIDLFLEWLSQQGLFFDGKMAIPSGPYCPRT